MAKGTLKISGADAFVAADLAPDSVGTSEIAADAVTGAQIADNTVDSEHYAAGSVDGEHIANDAVDSQHYAADSIDAEHYAPGSVDATAMAASLIGVKPHIIPDKLYPAWEGLLTDNTAYTVTDSSASAHAVVETVGDVHQSGSTKKIGTTSLSFPGTAQNTIRYADSADWDFGTGAFTIECWINTKKVSGSASTIMSRTVNDSTVLWMLRITSSARIEFTKNNASGSDHESGTYTTVASAWTHIAIVRGGADNNVRMYADGANIYTSGTDDTGDYDGSGEWWFGANPTGSQDYEGYIDDVRYTKGLAVYTGAFTPPTSALSTTWSANPFGGSNTVANSTASNVKLLLHLEGGGNVGAYGTAQADGHKYYYTDIKGSKPIKDPRIGAHFGSQRHTFNSLQILKQETATHGKNVYSIDGRSWCRAVSNATDWFVENGGNGNLLNIDSNATGSFVEITGYFNDINYIGITAADRANDVDITVNGDYSSRCDGATTFDATVTNPLQGRFVDGSSVINLGAKTALGSSTLAAELGTTPAINTVKIEYMATGYYVRDAGVELIAQDRTSVATKSQIQIPSQNVVSYGKKSTVAETKHYNPFAFKTDGTTAWTSGAHNSTAWPIGTGSSTKIHTATSLGLDAWISTNYYKPYNGGRVVKWIDTDGTIQTSVNMMPPNAKSIKNADIAKKANAAVANDTYLPTFESGAVDHSQSEVAKTFHWREFGNGSANHATGSGSTNYADASMLNGTHDDIAFVMDDGLTSLAGEDVEVTGSGINQDLIGDASAGGSYYIVFIGTGISLEARENSSTTNAYANIAQNLPYGTHILKSLREGDVNPDITIDGIAIDDITTGLPYGSFGEVSFHQPKMPPIPEDAVVIADYMLMADFVKQSTTVLQGQISKGVRYISGSRDHFADGGAAFTTNALHKPDRNPIFGISGGQTPSSTHTSYWELPFFGTRFLSGMEHGQGAHQLTINGTSVTEDIYDCAVENDCDLMGIPDASVATLGNNVAKTTLITGGYFFWGTHVDSPIHTSSHYQTFETPFLHELVGGDRNMEQTNLVVTPDGKTWDEVTRDVSYISKTAKCMMNTDTDFAWTSVIIIDDWRGVTNYKHYFNKDFAIAYDRLICLVDGFYEIKSIQYPRTGTASIHHSIKVNGTHAHIQYIGTTPSADHNMLIAQVSLQLKRNDYVQYVGEWGLDNDDYHHFSIDRLN